MGTPHFAEIFNSPWQKPLFPGPTLFKSLFWLYLPGRAPARWRSIGSTIPDAGYRCQWTQSSYPKIRVGESPVGVLLREQTGLPLGTRLGGLG